MSDYICIGTVLFVGAFWVWMIRDNRRQAVEIGKMDYRIDRLEFLVDHKQDKQQHNRGSGGEP